MATATGTFERCAVCNGFLNAHEPGHVQTSDAKLQHSVCHEFGEPQHAPLVNMPDDSKVSQNVQYNCGHYAYGPVLEVPETCPECGDTIV